MGPQVKTFVIFWEEFEGTYSIVTEPLYRGDNTNTGTCIHIYGLVGNVALFKELQEVSFVVFWG